MCGLLTYQVWHYPRSGDGRVANRRQFAKPRGRNDCGHSSARAKFEACVTPSQLFVIKFVSDALRPRLDAVDASIVAASAIAPAVVSRNGAGGQKCSDGQAAHGGAVKKTHGFMDDTVRYGCEVVEKWEQSIIILTLTRREEKEHEKMTVQECWTSVAYDALRWPREELVQWQYPPIMACRTIAVCYAISYFFQFFKYCSYFYWIQSGLVFLASKGLFRQVFPSQAFMHFHAYTHLQPVAVL
jgi:hypothetical protein